jgi:hypothetical protein
MQTLKVYTDQQPFGPIMKPYPSASRLRGKRRSGGRTNDGVSSRSPRGAGRGTVTPSHRGGRRNHVVHGGRGSPPSRGAGRGNRFRRGVPAAPRHRDPVAAITSWLRCRPTPAAGGENPRQLGRGHRGDGGLVRIAAPGCRESPRGAAGLGRSAPSGRTRFASRIG